MCPECPLQGGAVDEALITCYSRRAQGDHVFIKTLTKDFDSTLTFHVSGIKPWHTKGEKGRGLQECLQHACSSTLSKECGFNEPRCKLLVLHRPCAALRNWSKISSRFHVNSGTAR